MLNGNGTKKIPPGLTAASILEEICKLHLNCDTDYHRYIEQKFMESLSHTLQILEAIEAKSTPERIAEVAEGLQASLLHSILTDIEEWKKESAG